VRSEIIELPNGLTMHVPSKMEAGIVYHEIFETEAYLQHGVTVRDGDTVFDAGANVGFFSVFLATRWRNLRILAFEPALPVFELLEKNVRAHVRGSDLRLFPYGLSSKRDVLTFRFDPGRTLGTSAHGSEVEASARRDAAVSTWLRALVSDGARSGWMSPRASRMLLGCLDTPVVRNATSVALAAAVIAAEVHRRVRERPLRAEVRPLSDVIREEKVERIDLLKIDVEGAEWEVLAGIADADWPKIRQLVIEVHDTGGRVARVRDLLEARGFGVIVDREDWAIHELLGIRSVTARRSSDGRD
jgi:FkbM family methyltransferase